MAGFLNRLFSNLSAYFPWNLNPIKRFRDFSGDDEGNTNEEATPQKKQKLIRPAFSKKILTEVNAEPSGRPVTSRLNVEETFSIKLPMRTSWAGPYRVDDDQKVIPLENGASLKLPRRTRTKGTTSIDLTSDDDNEQKDAVSWRIKDLTRPSMRSVRGGQRRSLRSSTSSVSDCSILDDTNSRSSGEFYVEDDESSDEFDYDDKVIIINDSDNEFKDGQDDIFSKDIVDLTEQGSQRSTPENIAPRDRRRTRTSLPNGQQGNFRITRSSLNGSKPQVSIDLTNDSISNSHRRRNLSSRSLSSSNVSMVDLQECITYGRVLGSMLDGKMQIPQRPTPPGLSGTVDLTQDEERAPSVAASSNSLASNSLINPVVEEANEPPANISTSTQRGMKREIMRVNSFSEKIRDVACTQDEWVEKLLKDYEETQKEFKNTRDRFLREAIKWSHVNQKDVEALLEEKLNRHLHITEAAIPELEDAYEPIIKPLPELTPQMEERVRAAFSRTASNPTLISKFSLNITKKDIQTLSNLNWLNDEVINFYMQLLEQRCNDDNTYPPVHTFNTFFYTGLSRRGHSGMKRWTKKVDIFEKDIIIVPVHLQVHWCLAVIDLKKKELNYYDSMGKDNDVCLQNLKKYLKEEYKVKKEAELDMTDWKVSNVKNIPQQMNGCDCGVFACTFAEFSARRAPFAFDQSKMPYFRRKMAYEILTGQLLL